MRAPTPREAAPDFLAGPPSPLTRRLIREGVASPRVLTTGGRLGLLLGALRDIANDMPGVRATAKRAAMRERALLALQEAEQAFAMRDAAE